MFREQIGKTMEVYIDDMLIKSLKVANHIAHVEEAFSVLQKHKMMLNPSKCIFGVSSKKFLGFLVTKRGIEANPSQIQALLTMSSNIHEVQQLTRRVATLNRFVSRSADKCLPFFKIMRKNETFQWNMESEIAFQQLKEYLGPPPLLTVRISARHHYSPFLPQAKSSLYIYLSRLKYARLILQTPSGDQMEYAIRIKFKAANNEAKYEALLTGLRVATEIGVDSLDVFSDSQLVLNQVQGDYLTKDTRMVAYLDEVKTMSGKIRDFKIRQIPREENKKADALANLASAFDFILDISIPLEFLASPSIGIAKPVFHAEECPTRMDEIFVYLRDGTLSQDKLQACRIQYRHTRAPAQAPLQKKFLIVTIDYFTKWIEAQPLTKITEKILGISYGSTSFVDLESPKLSSRTMQGSSTMTNSNYFAQILPFLIIFSLPDHPQANGQVEVTNQTILRNLKVRLEISKIEWAEELPSILWTYHTTSQVPTGETLYSMVFGTESVIPVKIGMPSFRTSNFYKENNETELCLNLDFLNKKRERAELRQTTYKCQVTNYYNQRVKYKSFLLGDLVLQKVTLSTKEPNAEKTRSYMGRPL
ncbi:hypothetical protein Acr_07g0011250 [Actinidia rufa]|uniref:Uncharacterized protein n=1 Tax=Actinidia rufa TaxID=165716 RepID=A0A7J0EY86_9ERIC|nr:hypothetical protein Acr_07g0011250 [Actinidia rufa]